MAKIKPEDITSRKLCGNDSYYQCPETGIHYCCGKCNGPAGCASNRSAKGCACQTAPDIEPHEIRSEAQCAVYGDGKPDGYNYCPNTGMTYCCGKCTGTAPCKYRPNLGRTQHCACQTSPKPIDPKPGIKIT